MKTRTSSMYQEAQAAAEDFSPLELRHLRFLLRRLRFLETQLTASGEQQGGELSSGAAFASLELDALVWTLTDIGYLAERI